MAKTGSRIAATNAVDAIFTQAGILPELAHGVGFQQRVVQAELAFRKGTQPAIHEKDIVTAVNNLATTINAPAWARTNLAEVVKLRLFASPMFPGMILNHAPDAVAKHQLLNPAMSPLEATQIALMLVHQKLANPNYQLTRAEIVAQPDENALEDLHQHRTRALQSAMSGATSGRSLRDLLASADNFLTDLGLAPVQEDAK